MVELLCALGAAVVWVLIFALIVAAVDARRRTAGFISSVLIGYVVFYFFQVVLVKTLDVVHLLSTSALWIAYLITAVAAGVYIYIQPGGQHLARYTRPFLEKLKRGPLVGRIVLVTAAVAVLGLVVFTLVVPTHVWDVQAYHMPMVASYVQSESLSVGPTQDLRQLYRVNGAELQMLNIALLSRSDAWMELPNILALIVSLVAVFGAAKFVFKRDDFAYLAVILTLTAPQILYGAVTAKNDIIFLALILGTFYWTLHISADPQTRLHERLLFLGLTGSLAVATKVMGLNVAGAAGLVLLILVLLRRVPFRAVILLGGITLVGVLMLVGDLYWNNLVRAQVPVGIRPGEVNFTFGLTNLAAAAEYYLYDLSFKRLVTEQIFEHDFSHFGYLFPFLLIFGTVSALRQLVVRGKRDAVLAVLALLVFVLFVSVVIARQPVRWDQRFMIWMVPAFAILAISLFTRVKKPALLALVSFCSAFCILNVIQIVTNASDGIFAKSAMQVATDGELPRLSDVSQENYMYKIEGFDVLDSKAGESDSVLYVGAEDTWMYPAWGRGFTRHVSGVREAADVESQMGTGSYRFVVIEADAAASLKEATDTQKISDRYVEMYSSPNRSILERRSSIESANSRASRVNRPSDGSEE